MRKSSRGKIVSICLLLSLSVSACGGKKSIPDTSNIKKIEKVQSEKEIKIETETKEGETKESEIETQESETSVIEDNTVSSDVNRNPYVDDLISAYANKRIEVRNISEAADINECKEIIDNSYNSLINTKSNRVVGLFYGHAKPDKDGTISMEDTFGIDVLGFGVFTQNAAEQVCNITDGAYNIIDMGNSLITKMDGNFLSLDMGLLEDDTSESPFKTVMFNGVKECGLNGMFRNIGPSFGEIFESDYTIVNGNKTPDSREYYIAMRGSDKDALVEVIDGHIVECFILNSYAIDLDYQLWTFVKPSDEESEYYSLLNGYLDAQCSVSNYISKSVMEMWDKKLTDEEKEKVNWEELVTNVESGEFERFAREIASKKESNNKIYDYKETEEETKETEETKEEVLENSKTPWLDHSKNQVYINKYGEKAYPLSYYKDDNIDGLEELYDDSIQMFRDELNTTVEWMYSNDLDVDIDTSLVDSLKIYKPGETDKIVGIVHKYSDRHDDWVHVYFIIDIKNTSNMDVTIMDMSIYDLELPEDY